MNTDAIKNFIISSHTFTKLRTDRNTLCILPIGSLLRGNFIEGWSDIDLWVISQNTGLDYLQQIAEFKDEIRSETGIKTGVEIIHGDILVKLIEKPEMAAFYYKFVKNFWNQDKHLAKAPYYISDGYLLPLFNFQYIQNMSPVPYVLLVENALTNLLTDKNNFVQKKYLLRKLFKNCLFLMQTSLIKQRSANEVIHDFAEILKQFKDIVSYDLTVMEQIFEKKSKWYLLRDENISLQEIDAVWKIFLEIKETVLKK